MAAAIKLVAAIKVADAGNVVAALKERWFPQEKWLQWGNIDAGEVVETGNVVDKWFYWER